MSNMTYSFKEPTDKKIIAKMLYISSAKYGLDWHSTQHEHNFTEIFYILGGSGIFKINSYNYPVQKDDIVIVNPFVSHTEISDPSNPLEYIALAVDGFTLTSGTNNNRLSDYFIINYKEKRNEIHFCLKLLLDEIKTKESGYETACRNLLELFLRIIKKHVNYDFSTTSYVRSNYECSRIKEYIDNNFKKDITLDSLADYTHLNKYYLSHIFLDCYGIPPIKYLNQKRIEESKHLLVTTNYSILQIANIVGFSSQSYFSQIFKKSCGKTPLEYRKEFFKKNKR